MVTVGVTGIMGSGKTLVSGMFGKLGAEVIDADRIVRGLLRPGTPVWEPLLEAFGGGILDREGRLERSQLAGAVFSGDGDNLRKLNEIIHPEVLRIIRRRIGSLRKRGAKAAVIDAPLLIETGLHEEMDYIVSVEADCNSAAERIARRDAAGPEKFDARMRFQLPAGEKRKYADFVVDNSGPVENTRRQVESVWESIRKKKGNNFTGG